MFSVQVAAKKQPHFAAKHEDIKATMASPDGSSHKGMQSSSSSKWLVPLISFALCLTFLQLTTSFNQFGCISQSTQSHAHQHSDQDMIAPHSELNANFSNSGSERLEATHTDSRQSNTAEDHHSNDKTSGFFNLSSPIWPDSPPTFRNDQCKVIFRDPSLRLCHVIPWGANFGDEIGPPVVKRILELYFRCTTKDLATFNLWEKMNIDGGIMNRTQPCFMSVGSMFRMVRTGDHLWGTGVVSEKVVPHRCKTSKEPFGGQDLVTNLTVYSTRGPKSAGHMEQYCSSFIKAPLESAGDGAVLIPFIFPEMFRYSSFDHMNNRKPYCVIPHHYERNHGEIKNISSHAHILSVQRTWENMTMELLKCDKVLSSSLHGVIMAEILGIPSRRLRMTNKPGDFKFADFYESYRSQEPKPLTPSISQALDMIVHPLPMDYRSRYAARVLKTFPIHLFTTVDE
jgi:hypothetical protein